MRKMKNILAALVIAVGLMAPFGYAIAQEGQSSGLQVSPTRTELNVEAGTSESFDVAIKNVTPGSVNVVTSIDDFVPGEDGSPKLLPNSTEAQPQSIKNFIKGVGDFSLESGATNNAQYTAEIPAGQAPGAYYGVIRYQAVPSESGNDGGGQVALTASVGHIVLIQVPGDITESMQLESVKALRNDRSGSLFSQAPNKVQLSVKNTGNSFLKPFGTVTITQNGKTVYSYEVNNQDPKANVLPNSTRVFTDDIQNIGSVGRYTITATIAYSQGGEVLTTTSTFWVVPIWLAVLAGVLLVGLVVLIVFLVRKIKSRRK